MMIKSVMQKMEKGNLCIHIIDPVMSSSSESDEINIEEYEYELYFNCKCDCITMKIARWTNNSGKEYATVSCENCGVDASMKLV